MVTESAYTDRRGFAVRMLGGFTVFYDGREVALGRNGSARFMQLLQLVWLQGNGGISKEKLVESLYDREKITNINSSFNTLVYRMRQQMTAIGLPDAEYVVRRKGLYTADEKIPVWVDALEFERLVLEGDRAESEEEKLRCYQGAFELYQGDLLLGVSSGLWVLEKSVRYKRLFGRCVQWLGDYAKRGRDYQAMEVYYSKAVALYPLEEWEIGLIDTLLTMGEYKRAYKLYDRTVRLYSDELGLPPPDKMLDCYRRMSEKMVHLPCSLEEVHDLLKESENENGGVDGAYYCSYPSFIDAYRLLSRNMERSGFSMYLILCTITDYEGKAVQNEEKLKVRSAAVNEAIRTSLRRGDIFTKYSASQYLILAMNLRREDCDTIYRRLNAKLKNIVSSQARLNYQAMSIARCAAS